MIGFPAENIVEITSLPISIDFHVVSNYRVQGFSVSRTSTGLIWISHCGWKNKRLKDRVRERDAVKNLFMRFAANLVYCTDAKRIDVKRVSNQE